MGGPGARAPELGGPGAPAPRSGADPPSSSTVTVKNQHDYNTFTLALHYIYINTTLYYTTLFYTLFYTLCYIFSTLCYATLHLLHYTTLHNPALQHTTLHSITSQYGWWVLRGVVFLSFLRFGCSGEPECGISLACHCDPGLELGFSLGLRFDRRHTLHCSARPSFGRVPRGMEFLLYFCAFLPFQ